MACGSGSGLDWTSVKFVFYDVGSNQKNNLYTLLKFIDQRFVYVIILIYQPIDLINNLLMFRI